MLICWKWPKTAKKVVKRWPKMAQRARNRWLWPVEMNPKWPKMTELTCWFDHLNVSKCGLVPWKSPFLHNFPHIVVPRFWSHLSSVEFVQGLSYGRPDPSRFHCFSPVNSEVSVLEVVIFPGTGQSVMIGSGEFRPISQAMVFWRRAGMVWNCTWLPSVIHGVPWAAVTIGLYFFCSVRKAFGLCHLRNVFNKNLYFFCFVGNLLSSEQQKMGSSLLQPHFESSVYTDSSGGQSVSQQQKTGKVAISIPPQNAHANTFFMENAAYGGK